MESVSTNASFLRQKFVPQNKIELSPNKIQLQRTRFSGNYQNLAATTKIQRQLPNFSGNYQTSAATTKLQSEQNFVLRSATAPPGIHVGPDMDRQHVIS
jgi:hypothetical protein